MVSSAGVGLIVSVQGTLNADFYKTFLIQHAVINAVNLQSTTGQFAIFMQDNAPCHKARSLMLFFQAENIEVMD